MNNRFNPHPTASDLMARASEPQFAVFIGENGDAAIKVTGVLTPFNFVVPRQILCDASPWGKPTPNSIMFICQQRAREEIEKREQSASLFNAMAARN